MTASSTPSTIPSACAASVSSIVTTTPLVIRWSSMKCPTCPHWNRLFVAIELTIAIEMTSTIAAATQRPGWRTGTALMSSGPGGCESEDTLSGVVVTRDPRSACRRLRYVRRVRR